MSVRGRLGFGRGVFASGDRRLITARHRRPSTQAFETLHVSPLGTAIFRAELDGILVKYPEAERTRDDARGELPTPDREARVAADRVNDYRNNLMHANPERKTPDSTFQVNELTDRVMEEVDADGDETTVGWLRYAGEAKNALRDVKIVFDHLYPGA